MLSEGNLSPPQNDMDTRIRSRENKQLYVCIAAEGEAHNIVSCLTFVKIGCFVIKTIANVKVPNVLSLMVNTLIC